MPKDDTSKTRTPRPVAYDKDGRPLYAAPPEVDEQTNASDSQFVHYRRAVNPEMQEIPDHIKKKHDESKKKYPTLNLSEAEFVISEVRRHPAGLVIPLGTIGLMILLIISVILSFPILARNNNVVEISFGSIFLIGSLLVVLLLLVAYVVFWVYRNNKFFLTNESVIQEIQTSLFAHHEQTVSLANIEDASYQKQGIIQSMFDYGSIRLSTEGDETTYRFNYVSGPKRQIAILNNAVEAFKNGRPVVDDN